MANAWLSLADAADELEVSPRTIRRWVHAGKLPAELRSGSHGPQYYLPGEAVRLLQADRQVEQPVRRVDVERVVEVVASYLDVRDQAFRAEQNELREELRSVRAQLHQAYADLTRAQQAIWQQCQDLAQTRRVMEQLATNLNVTREGVQATRVNLSRRREARSVAEDAESAKSS